MTCKNCHDEGRPDQHHIQDCPEIHALLFSPDEQGTRILVPRVATTARQIIEARRNVAATWARWQEEAKTSGIPF